MSSNNWRNYFINLKRFKMEAREILVANTKTQTRSKITTNASTLGELKAALSASGIDYAGMDFTEGISKTHLLDDTTPLPKDIMYKGTPTNNLVILLTNMKKNIASGCGSRKEAYDIIKENGLEDAVKNTYGKNYTIVPTEALWDIINRWSQEDDGNDIDEEEEDEYPFDGFYERMTLDEMECVMNQCINALASAKESRDEKIMLAGKLIKALADILVEPKKETIEINGSQVTDEEIDAMIDSL